MTCSATTTLRRALLFRLLHFCFIMERPGPLVVWDSSSSAYWEGWRKAAARKATPEQRSDWSVYVRQLRLRQEYEERLWDLAVQEEIEEEESQRLLPDSLSQVWIQNHQNIPPKRAWNGWVWLGLRMIYLPRLILYLYP